MNTDIIRLPGCFPDVPAIRTDVADYYWEVERFDRLVGDALEQMDRAGETDNTLVVMTGDHGMPFPRCKSNLYDTGTRVPLAMHWPGGGKSGRTVNDLVSLTDLAPTFLELAGLSIPAEMTGRSLLPLLTSDKSGQVDPRRTFVLVGKERHVPAQEAPDLGGYPCRAIRTRKFLYIRNYHPERWPAGTPHYQRAAIPGAWYADCDNGPTKTYMIQFREKDPTHHKLFELSFAKRPAEELYDLNSDPDQLRNVAQQPGYAVDRGRLATRLRAELQATGDPRAQVAGGVRPNVLDEAIGDGNRFDLYPYLGSAPKHPDFQKPE
jgi:arylsulfatase A-like enzyme